MVFFITLLRALAACLITNAHYTDVYPIDLIASGGLLGDVIFFGVSGYCLYNIRQSFPRWYGKRLIRCYLPVILITALYLLLGSYKITSEQSFIYWFIYPTYYHFIASIVLLYVLYYFVIKTPFLKTHIGSIMAVTAILYVAVYLLFYDRSYYHIDNVREPMIRFLFFECMLLGAWFKQHDEKFRNKQSLLSLLGVLLSFCVYFACKLTFSKYQAFSQLQGINQIVLFAFLFFIFRASSGYDCVLEKLPPLIKRVIRFIADITLEIYLVQYVLIDLLRTVAPFPLNWIAITASILLAATALHYIVKFLLSIFKGPKNTDK